MVLVLRITDRITRASAGNALRAKTPLASWHPTVSIHGIAPFTGSDPLTSGLGRHRLASMTTGPVVQRGLRAARRSAGRASPGR